MKRKKKCKLNEQLLRMDFTIMLYILFNEELLEARLFLTYVNSEDSID